jgi:hypothetical protein
MSVSSITFAATEFHRSCRLMIAFVAELAFLEHRVDRDHGRAQLPGGEQADDELRHVLQVQGDPVAPPQAEACERRGEGVTVPVDLHRLDRRVEVVAQGLVAVAHAARPGPPGRQHVGLLRHVLGVFARLVEPPPRPFVVSAHALLQHPAGVSGQEAVLSRLPDGDVISPRR